MRTRGKGRKPPITCPERLAWLAHKHGAKVRGICFEFTYEQWVGWWKKQLGTDWFTLRGTGVGQYVMARFGDKGPYAPGNVRCATGKQNRKEGLLKQNRGYAKLTEDQVREIYLRVKAGPKGTIPRMAEKFRVTDRTVRDIANKLTWNHITDPLD